MSIQKQIKIIDEISGSFSNTPVIKIVISYLGREYSVYGKYETCSFSGSVKDRMIRHIIKNAYETGKLKEGFKICEATSGNTGIAVTSLGKFLGHDVEIFIPDWMSKERFKTLKLLGANLNLITKEDGGFERAVSDSQKEGEKEGSFCVNQFCNPLNVVAQSESTAKELLEFCNKNSITPDTFVAGVGTGGVVMGFERYRRVNNLKYSVHALEPKQTPILTAKKIETLGNHRIDGIADDFLPKIVDLNLLDAPVSIDDGDAVVMAQNVCKQGVSFGLSSGANLVGCIKAMHEKNERGENSSVAITIFCDSMLKYLSTDLVNTEPEKPDHLTKDIKIVGIETF